MAQHLQCAVLQWTSSCLRCVMCDVAIWEHVHQMQAHMHIRSVGLSLCVGIDSLAHCCVCVCVLFLGVCCWSLTVCHHHHALCHHHHDHWHPLDLGAGGQQGVSAVAPHTSCCIGTQSCADVVHMPMAQHSKCAVLQWTSYFASDVQCVMWLYGSMCIRCKHTHTHAHTHTCTHMHMESEGLSLFGH